MLPYGLVIGFDGCFALFVVLGADIIRIGSERHLAVDDDACTICALDDDVGTQVLALFVLDIVLYEVLFTLAQSAVVQDIGQYLFAPVALHFAAILEGIGKRLGGLVSCLVVLDDGANALCQRSGVLVATLLAFGNEFAQQIQFAFERVNHLLHVFGIGFLELLGARLHFLLKLRAHTLACELQFGLKHLSLCFCVLLV